MKHREKYELGQKLLITSSEKAKFTPYEEATLAQGVIAPIFETNLISCLQSTSYTETLKFAGKARDIVTSY